VALPHHDLPLLIEDNPKHLAHPILHDNGCVKTKKKRSSQSIAVQHQFEPEHSVIQLLDEALIICVFFMPGSWICSASVVK
jgi:hypothetical protein